MNQRWPTWKFALVVIPSLLFIAFIVSLFSDIRVITAVTAAATLVSLILQYGSTGIDHDATDHHEGKDDINRTTAQQPSDEQQEPVLSQESNSDTSRVKEDTDDTAEPRNRSGLLKSNEEIVEEVGGKLSDHVNQYGGGAIEIIADDVNLYSEMMLYVIAKRLAYEDRHVDTPEVSVEELRNHCGYNKIEVLLFLDEARSRLIPPHSLSFKIGTLDYSNADETTFKVPLRDLPDIADWALEDGESSPFAVSPVGNAAMALHEAREHYERAQELEDEDDYSGAQKRYNFVKQQIATACRDVKQYPIEVGYDGNWHTFTKNAEMLLDNLPEQTLQYLPEMERAVENMEEKAGEACYL